MLHRFRRTVQRAGLPALAALAIAGLITVGCDEDPADPRLKPDGVHLLVISGNNQSGLPGEELPEPLVVRAVDAAGRPLHRVTISFVPTLGGGHPWAGAANTDPQGYATEYWTLGPEPGENRMEARVVDPKTKEKLVLGEFVATASWDPSAPTEICDGADNDNDNEIDENLVYCNNGSPALHSDGAECDEGWIDFDGDTRNGCEEPDNIDGTYTFPNSGGQLMVGPGYPYPPGCELVHHYIGDVRIYEFDLTRLSTYEIRIDIPFIISGIALEWRIPSVLTYEIGTSYLTGGSNNWEEQLIGDDLLLGIRYNIYAAEFLWDGSFYAADGFYLFSLSRQSTGDEIAHCAHRGLVPLAGSPPGTNG